MFGGTVATPTRRRWPLREFIKPLRIGDRISIAIFTCYVGGGREGGGKGRREGGREGGKHSSGLLL